MTPYHVLQSGQRREEEFDGWVVEYSLGSWSREIKAIYLAIYISIYVFLYV